MDSSVSPEIPRCLKLFLDLHPELATINVVMTNFVSIAGALADETRWRIVRLVMNDALCVCELAEIFKMPQSSVSSHVQVIRKAGLLVDEKCEKWTYFRIAPTHRKMIGSLVDYFQDEKRGQFSRDLTRTKARLARRENSCCPGPRILAQTSKR